MSILFTVTAPATSANLGPGFDSFGIALSRYNIFTVREILPSGDYEIDVSGEGSAELSAPENNLVVTAYEAACRKWGVVAPGFSFACQNVIPLCRGLGSSSTAVVAGVLIADRLTGRGATDDELLRVMTEIEGHPDNVAPCFLGGMTVSCWDGKNLHYLKLPPLPREISCVVAVPDVRVKTEDARAALPDEIPFADAAFNVAHAALLAALWSCGKWDDLKIAMDDRLHEPYRAKLFPGGEEVLSAVKELPECIGAAISGSGPAILALVRGQTDRAVKTVKLAFNLAGVASYCIDLANSERGARVEIA